MHGVGGGALDISIHALRKESDQERLRDFQSVVISIHALRKESDPDRLSEFQCFVISSHALRKESDSAAADARRNPHDFNPRSP